MAIAGEAGHVIVPRKSRDMWQDMKRHWYVYAMIAPCLALIVFFRYFPGAISFVESFFIWEPGLRNDWAGLANYRTVLKDSVFWVSFRNTLIIATWSFAIPFCMPILIAEAIFNLKSTAAKNFYRVVILIPLLVPGIVNLMLWKWMYTYPAGGINLILTAIGLGDLTRPWLALMSTALPALLLMGFPWVTGTAPLIYLAGLMNISSEVLDAAQIDGCSLFQRIIHVDLPHIVGQIRLFLIFDIIGVLQGFGTQLAITRGGPSNATMVPGLYVYKKAFGLERFEMAYPEMGAACAVAVILFITIFGLTFVANKYARISGISSD